jgi:hypothetical protein
MTAPALAAYKGEIPGRFGTCPGCLSRHFCGKFELVVQSVHSHTPNFSRIFRRGGALVSAMWVLLLWVSPAAFSIWAASPANACGCCPSKNSSSCKRHHDAAGPQLSSDSCGSSCQGCGSFLQADSAPCLPGSTKFGVPFASYASRVIHGSPAVRAAWNAEEFQRPPPSC